MLGELTPARDCRVATLLAMTERRDCRIATLLAMTERRDCCVATLLTMTVGWQKLFLERVIFPCYNKKKKGERT